MLEDGLSYPLRDDWIGRTIIGGILGILAPLILPGLILFGYFVEVLRSSANGDETPPEFGNWGKMLKEGAVGIIISLVYSFVPLLAVGGASAILVGGGSLVGGEGGAALSGFGLLIMFLLFIPAIFVVYYIVPAALTAYATENTIGAAFDLKELKPVVLSSDYLIAVLAPIVVAVIVWVVTTLLSITVIGLVLVPFLQFYSQVAIFRMFGVAYHEQKQRAATI